ncbi:osteopontin isoform X2 [Dunckerocampus dactyliophorus]|uniref:osteopontin isoform X2 n=1 Tax=Dunckerocampus dactyliophorus TaxID=161453 RepID=UPI0024075908|nr:osteopontin isoform X2 [Dunckerocampus dactyliophorus]
MKVAFVFVLLFAAVLCRPARKYSDSSAESSEEVVRRPAAPLFRKKVAEVSRIRAAAIRAFQRFFASPVASSDESTDSSDEVAVETPAVVNYETTDPAASDTPPVNNEDSDDDDDDDDESEESDSDEEEEEEDEEDSSESGEDSTVAPETVTPVVVTDEPLDETTEDPLVPTIVTDTDSGRGDSMGGYPSDYKTYVYVEKGYPKAPSPYKSYQYVDKKTGYDTPTDNEVEKSANVYKVETYQAHSDLEEDSSTPDEESQNLDTAGPSESQDVLPEEEEEEEESAGTTESGSSSTPEEEEETEQSSEETAATPGASDSDSDESDSTESDSDEHGMGPEPTADTVVITAK